MIEFDVILRHLDDTDSETSRFCFQLKPSQEVTFGRATTNEIAIPDPERKVSSRHGILRHDPASGLMVLDLDSLNGIFVEGQRVRCATGTAIQYGSQVQVGEYQLEIAMPEEVATIPSKPSSQTRPHADALIQTLEEAYDSSITSPASLRLRSLQGAVTALTTPIQPQQATSLLRDALEQTTGIASPIAAGTSLQTNEDQRVPSAISIPTPAKTEQAAGTKDAADLERLAQQLLQGQPATPADRTKFADLMQQFCAAMLSWLSKNLQSRSVFAEEFGAEVTLVFQRSTNPLKAMSLEDLQSYLLDWRDPTDAATRLYYLDGVLNDLTEHQMGVIAGVKDAIASILDRLSPERIEATAKQSSGWSKAGKNWSAYQQLHRELATEQSKLYGELITPALQKGYLQQHEASPKRSPTSEPT
jgi:type VI secretion system protein ImpI